MKNVSRLVLITFILCAMASFAAANTNATYHVSSSAYETSKGVVLENFSNESSWAATYGTVEDDTTHTYDGDGAIKITVNGSAHTNDALVKNITATQLGRAENFILYYYVDNRTNWKQLEIRLSSVSSGSYYAYGRIYQTARTGWNACVIPRNKFMSQGAENWSNATVQMKIVVTPQTNSTVSVSLDSLRYNYSGAPTVVIGVDDGNVSTYEIAYPIMKQYNMPGCLYIITDRVGQDTDCTISQLQEMNADGWDIASHTLSHAQLTTLNGTELTRQLQGSHDWLAANGFGKGSLLISYPNGLYNTAVTDETKKYYALGRTTQTCDQEPHIQNMSDDELFAMKHYEVYSTTSMTTLKDLVDNNTARQGMLILTFHAFSENGNESNYFYSRANFSELCAYIEASNNTVVAMSDYVIMDVPAHKACIGDSVSIAPNGACSVLTDNVYPTVISSDFNLYPSSTITATIVESEGMNKTWIVGSDTHDASVQHIIGGFTPGADIAIFRDNIYYDRVTANSTGYVDWTYSGGFSSHTFSTEDYSLVSETAGAVNTRMWLPVISLIGVAILCVFGFTVVKGLKSGKLPPAELVLLGLSLVMIMVVLILGAVILSAFE